MYVLFIFLDSWRSLFRLMHIVDSYLAATSFCLRYLIEIVSLIILVVPVLMPRYVIVSLIILVVPVLMPRYVA